MYTLWGHTKYYDNDIENCILYSDDYINSSIIEKNRS